MSINDEAKNANVNPNVIIHNIEEQNNINNNKSPQNSKIVKSPVKSNSNSNDNFKKEKKKRNRKKKTEKLTKSKNLNSSESNFSGGILSEIRQISIPIDLSEKEKLFKILQSEIINIDKSISLLVKKKKYYNEISQKLSNEIQNEKKKLKKNEIKNKEYLYMENILKDYDINDTYDNLSFIGNNNSYYYINKNIDKTLDYNYFLLNAKNFKNFLLINFNKMEPNNQLLSYEEFNNMSELDNNFCLLMSNNSNNIDNKDDNDNKIICDSEENKEKEKISENKMNKSNINSQTPNRNKNMIDVENDEFTIIDEALPEEEETNMKKKNKISIGSNKNNDNDDNNNSNDNINKKIKGKDIDKSINKKYSENLEELDFYLLKDSRKNEIKEKKKKKITFEDIQKKYKTQDMGSDFINQESSNICNSSSSSSSSKEKKAKKKNKKKKNKNKNKSNSTDSNKNEESEKEKNDLYNKDDNDKDDNNNECIENSELSQDNESNNGNKKKKRGRKKKKKDTKKTFSLEEELPDPDTLDSTALALEMKKYGMKPQNKKRNIEVLKSVYNFLKIKELPENISHKLTTFDLDKSDDDSDNEKDNENKSKKNDGNISMTELSDEQKKKIIEIIKDNKTIYEKILLFKEISLKEIKTLLNAKGIIISNHLLTKLLIDSGVVLPGGWNDKK